MKRNRRIKKNKENGIETPQTSSRIHPSTLPHPFLPLSPFSLQSHRPSPRAIHSPLIHPHLLPLSSLHHPANILPIHILIHRLHALMVLSNVLLHPPPDPA